MINILITCAGGKFVYDLISSIKNEKDLKIKFIGVDVDDSFNPFFLDKFYKVPRADINFIKYLNKIKTICKKEKIKIIFPLSENESKIFSKKILYFKKKKIQIPISNFDIIQKLIDKFEMLNLLKEKKVNVGKFNKIDHINELDDKLKNLGYPNRKIILKPRNSSGSRGIFVFNEKVSNFKNLLTDRICGEGNYKNIIAKIKNNLGSLDNYLIMPYYEGPTYDVDCLADRGKVVEFVARLRNYKNPFSPTNEGCTPTKNNIIFKYVKEIVNAFNLNGCCDFDIIINNNIPRVIDISGRMSGSVSAGFLAGENIFANSIRNILGKKRVKYHLRKNLKIYPTTKLVIQ